MKTKICTAINRNVPNAEPLPKAGDILAGWITRLTQLINVLPVGIRKSAPTTVRKLSIHMKTAICTVITPSAIAVAKNWRVGGIPAGQITHSVEIHAQNVDIQNPVPTPIVRRHILTIPVPIINEPPSVIPVVSHSIQQQNRTHGHMEIGLHLPVHNINAPNPVYVEDLPAKPLLTASAATPAGTADTPKQAHLQYRLRYRSRHPVQAVHSVLPAVKLLRKNIPQAIPYRLLPADVRSQKSYIRSMDEAIHQTVLR